MGRLSDKSSTKLDCEVTLINAQPSRIPLLSDLVRDPSYVGQCFSLSDYHNDIRYTRLITVIDNGLIFLSNYSPKLISKEDVLSYKFAPMYERLVRMHFDLRLHFPATGVPGPVITADDAANCSGVYVDESGIGRGLYRISSGGDLFLLVAPKVTRICRWSNVRLLNSYTRYFSRYTGDLTLTFYFSRSTTVKVSRCRVDIQTTK